MEILAIILSGLALILCTVILVVLLKKKEATISKNDIEEIKKGQAEEISKLSSLVISSIEITNKHFLELLALKLEEYEKGTQGQLKQILDTVEKSLIAIKTETSERLNAIQGVVEEKLQKSIDEKLKASFESVIMHIGNVNKAIGEIKSIANDVGSLKNVLTNVKTRGITGEILLGGIIQEILSPEQYETNIATKKGSKDVVEFAVKIPTENSQILLPVDSKFPLSPYEKLKNAFDTGDRVMVESARKELRSALRLQARTISSKYIDVPNTTDFAIMFLPTEGLYIEAIEGGLFEEFQREFKIIISGPTTFSALISALKLGFTSVEIQKRSGEVFKLLGVIRTEFDKFARALSNTQKRFKQAENELDELVGKRTRIMQEKLDSISALSNVDEAGLLS